EPLESLRPTPSPAPPPTSVPTIKPATHAIAARSHASAHAVQSDGSGADVRRQVAALSDAEAATPSPAMTGEDFIGEMAAAGYTNVSVDDLIKLKSLGVNGTYVRELRAAGLGRPSINELAELRSVGVTPQFAGDMHRMFPSVSIEDI